MTTFGRDTAAVAAIKRDRVLARVAYPRALDATEAATGAQGEITLVLALSAGTTRLVGLSRVERPQYGAEHNPGNKPLTDYNAVNNFFSSNTTNVVSSGSATPSQYIEADTTFRDAIESRLQLGDGAGGAYAWGYMRTGCSACSRLRLPQAITRSQAMRTSTRQAGCALRRGMSGPMP